MEMKRLSWANDGSPQLNYPNLSNYLRELYQMPGIAEIVKPRDYVMNYYSIAKLNPTEIIPKGTPVDLGNRTIERGWRHKRGRTVFAASVMRRRLNRYGSRQHMRRVRKIDRRIHSPLFRQPYLAIFQDRQIINIEARPRQRFVNSCRFQR
jgi:hypothetical protein